MREMVDGFDPSREPLRPMDQSIEKPEWRGLNVAELAKSFGRHCNLPKAYAASATSST